MAHGQDADTGKAVRIAVAALAASVALDAERSRMYGDLILMSASEAARKELQSMDPTKYEFQSDFARRYIALGRLEGKVEGKVEGKAEGLAEGRAALVIKLLAQRFGPLPDDVQARISRASVEDLDAIAERLLTAETLQQALDSH